MAQFKPNKVKLKNFIKHVHCISRKRGHVWFFRTTHEKVQPELICHFWRYCPIHSKTGGLYSPENVRNAQTGVVYEPFAERVKYGSIQEKKLRLAGKIA